MYNNLTETSNLLSIFMKITFHYKLSNSAQRKIFSRFLIIFGQFGKKKKNLAKWEKLCSGHLLNWKISLFLSYWTMIDVMQTRMNCVLVTVYCVSVWIHSYQFLFYIEPILKTSSRISTETRSSKYTSSYFWCSSLQRTICRLLFLIWCLDQDILASHEWNFAELTSLKKWTSMFLAK